MRGALILLVITAVAAAAGEAALMVASPAPYPLLLIAYPALGAAMVVVGAWIWDLRPPNQTGRLTALVGLTILAAAAGNVSNRWFVLLGVLMAEVPISALLHLVVAFSSWRLDGGRPWIVAFAYVHSVTLQIPIYLFAEIPPELRVFAVTPRPAMAELADRVQSGIGSVFILWLTANLVWRWRSAPVLAERRTLALAYGYCIFSLASLPITARLVPLLGGSTYLLFGVQLAIIAGVPVMLAATVLGRGLRQTMGLTELVSLTGTIDASPSTVRDILARTLQDPTLELMVGPGPDDRANDNGEDPVRVVDGSRAVVVIQGPSTIRSVITYDRQSIDDPAIVRQMGEVATLALQHERLTGQLRRTQDELRESRLRIVDAGDQQRLRLARDLHDGVQSRLVFAAMLAAQRFNATDDGEARTMSERLLIELESAIDEIRRLAHGAMPALLLDRGLYDAVEDIVDRLPLRSSLQIRARPTLSPSTAISGYFITAEALANVVKHAGADRVEVVIDLDHLAGSSHCEAVRIHISDDGKGGADPLGPGLRNAADRAEALGGQLVLISKPGEGTDLIARLPCES